VTLCLPRPPAPCSRPQAAAGAIVGAVDLLAGAETAALEASRVRTLAYVSGPAYGLLLDASSPGWTRRVRGTDDLATLVMRALAVQPSFARNRIVQNRGGHRPAVTCPRWSESPSAIARQHAAVYSAILTMLG
jgi:hypothetical protein